MSELKVTLLKPRDAAEEDFSLTNNSNMHLNQEEHSGDASSSADNFHANDGSAHAELSVTQQIIADREAQDAVNPLELRDEHEQRRHEQQENIETLDRDTLHELLRQMVLIRRFEEKSAEAYSLGKIGGFCHLYIGQEAVCVGSISALRPDDYVLTSYREHGHAISKGIHPDEVMAELYGKAGGCSSGNG